MYMVHLSNRVIEIANKKFKNIPSWNDCRPLAKVYGKKESFILYVSNHVFDLGHLYSSNCGLNALHKIISLLKGKKIFHMIIQFWDICEKNMENEQWQINRKKR